MDIFWRLLIIACILVPSVYALYYFGILITRADASWFRAGVSLPTRWEGTSAGTTGFQRRNFAILRKYSTLAVEADTASGTFNFEVNGPDGSPLSPVSGTYGPDTRVLFDVGRYKRCTVTLRMKQFHGQFRITLQ